MITIPENGVVELKNEFENIILVVTEINGGLSTQVEVKVKEPYNKEAYKKLINWLSHLMYTIVKENNNAQS